MNKKYITLKNIPAPFNIKYYKSYDHISKWLLDKVLIERINKKVTKIEVYNYFDIKDIKLIIKYLESYHFKSTKNATLYPPYWSFLLNLEWEHIKTIKSKENSKKIIKIIDPNDKKNKFFYYIFYVRVHLHRNNTYLIKLYWNKSKNKKFFKLEITYWYKEKWYNLHFLDFLNSLKGINEILRKIEKKFTPIWYKEDFSKKITLDSFIFQIMWNIWKSKINQINNIFSKLTGINYTK